MYVGWSELTNRRTSGHVFKDGWQRSEANKINSPYVKAHPFAASSNMLNALLSAYASEHLLLHPNANITPCPMTPRSLRRQPICHLYTVGHKKRCAFYVEHNFGKYGPILIILSPFQSFMNCRVRWNKLYHLSMNLLLHLRNLNIQMHLYSSYSIQKWCKLCSQRKRTSTLRINKCTCEFIILNRK